MTYSLLVLVVDIVLAVLILKRWTSIHTIVFGLWVGVGMVNLYHALRFFYAVLVENTNGWNDLIYAVLFLYGSFAWIVFGLAILGALAYLKRK